MSIEIQVLGRPGDDNATLMRVDSGTAVHRLLFDCGERCLNSLSISEIQSIDHVFFSHFHMDHICGFDQFFRHNYNRPQVPVTIWGPQGTISVIHHRMRGYTWNLHHRQPGYWVVNELHEKEIRTATFRTRDAFRKAHKQYTHSLEADGSFLRHQDFSASSRALPHGNINSLGYRIDEPERENIDPNALKKSGLKPGPWIKELKELHEGEVEVGGEKKSILDLRQQLLVASDGDSAAYLTDFKLDPGSDEWIATVDWLKDVNTLVSEAQYYEADHSLAEANSHMTTHRVGLLAHDIAATRLIIQHVSRRYPVEVWREMLDEAKAVFPESAFPDWWRV